MKGRFPATLAAGSMLLIAGVAGVACSEHDIGPYHASVPPMPASQEAGTAGDTGQVLYLRDCAWCHGAHAEGTPRAPDLRSGTKGPADVDFVLRTRRMPLRKPDDPMRRGAATTAYSDRDREAIVAYLAGLGQAGPTVPYLSPNPPSLSRGAELYLANCAACHSATGIGGTLSAAQRSGAPDTGGPETFAPGITSSTRVEVAEAIRVGPGTMPVFGPKTLTDDDVDAIAAYVKYLGRTADPGGLTLGHIGPVTEGAVGWLIGLGLLLGVSRWIGTRTGEEPPPKGKVPE
ncbi:MAG TPA: c-type cytochrome [Acidimicrobiia bacterium]|nr:c-type cytochrome [Acidimicrobiia bacterium]HZQ78842.1 c-type cytochrome [Acidimicrobiia bacterium]